MMNERSFYFENYIISDILYSMYPSTCTLPCPPSTSGSPSHWCSLRSTSTSCTPCPRSPSVPPSTWHSLSLSRDTSPSAGAWSWLESIPNRRRGVAVLFQCTALEQNFGMVSTVAEVLRSKNTAPEQIFWMVSSVCVAIVLHFTALEQNYMAEDQFFWNDVNNCKLLLSKI